MWNQENQAQNRPFMRIACRRHGNSPSWSPGSRGPELPCATPGLGRGWELPLAVVPPPTARGLQPVGSGARMHSVREPPPRPPPRWGPPARPLWLPTRHLHAPAGPHTAHASPTESQQTHFSKRGSHRKAESCKQSFLRSPPHPGLQEPVPRPSVQEPAPRPSVLASLFYSSSLGEPRPHTQGLYPPDDLQRGSCGRLFLRRGN